MTIGNSQSAKIDRDKQIQRRARCVHVLIAIESAFLIAMCTLDFGGMFPSRSGLSLDHFAILFSLNLVAIITGSAIAIQCRLWRLLAVQMLLPVVAIALGCVLGNISEKRYDPGTFQSLVGKTRLEVDTILGPGAETGYQASGNGFFITYRGMKIRYNRDSVTRSQPAPDEKVLAVESCP